MLASTKSEYIITIDLSETGIRCAVIGYDVLIRTAV